jgi:hypothetical protein
MKFYIDLTNLLSVDFVTGIQRVAREITIRLLEHPEHEWHLLCWSERIGCWLELDNERFLRYFRGDADARSGMVTQTTVRPEAIPSGAVFFDIDSVWNAKLKRSWLFPLLKQRGVCIATQLYDLIPITHPQFCHENTCANFMVYVGANLKYADLIITSAQTTIDVLNSLTDRIGLDRKKATVVGLSSDFSKKNDSNGSVDPAVNQTVPVY